MSSSGTGVKNDSSVDGLLGTLVASTWLNSMLFGIGILQLHRYLRTYKKEVYVKLIVLLLYAVDIAGLFGQYSTVYLDAVTHYGDRAYLNAPEPAPRGMYLAAIQTQGLIVQCYLISRIWRLSQNIWISMLLWCGSLLSFGGGLGLTIINVTFKSLTDRSRQTTVTSIWLIGAAVVDVLIALILVYYFYMAKRKSSFAHTHHVLSRLMASSLESGSITAVLAIVVLVTFNTMKKTNWPVAFVYLLGRSYSLTMMYSLNARAELRAHNTSTHYTSDALSMSNRITTGRTQARKSGVQHGIEIQVAHSAVEHVDNEAQKEEEYSGSDEGGKPHYIVAHKSLV